MDHVFEVENQTKISEYVQNHGWAEFRRKEEQIFIKTIMQETGIIIGRVVISTGGGIVESSK